MLIDLHIHTTISPCSRLKLDDILVRSPGLGLDGVCITDHGSNRASGLVRDGINDQGLFIAVGMEFTTPQGDFLLYGDTAFLQPRMEGREVLTLAAAAGTVAVAAHPCRRGQLLDVSLLADGLCPVIEVLNGRNTDEENAEAAKLAEQYGLVAVAGSDAHRLADLGTFPTKFSVPVATLADLQAALLAGHCEPAPQPRPGLIRRIFGR